MFRGAHAPESAFRNGCRAGRKLRIGADSESAGITCRACTRSLSSGRHNCVARLYLAARRSCQGRASRLQRRDAQRRRRHWRTEEQIAIGVGQPNAGGALGQAMQEDGCAGTGATMTPMGGVCLLPDGGSVGRADLWRVTKKSGLYDPRMKLRPRAGRGAASSWELRLCAGEVRQIPSRRHGVCHRRSGDPSPVDASGPNSPWGASWGPREPPRTGTLGAARRWTKTECERVAFLT